ncbi:hypothetical protein O1L44_23395 [Streptomyces noursei]|nr:hypothetical protein [Streptomyces noursei]
MCCIVCNEVCTWYSSAWIVVVAPRSVDCAAASTRVRSLVIASLTCVSTAASASSVGDPPNRLSSRPRTGT